MIWGYNVTSMEIEGLLEKRNIHVAFTVDSNRMLVDDDLVKNVDILKCFFFK